MVRARAVLPTYSTPYGGSVHMQSAGHTVHQPRHVVGVGGITAQESMVPEVPQSAGLDVASASSGAAGLSSGSARPALGRSLARSRAAPETGVVGGETGQERSQGAFSAVARAPIGSRLARTSRSSARESSTYSTGHGWLAPADRLLDPGVTIDDVAGGAVDHDLGDPADASRAPAARALLPG